MEDKWTIVDKAVEDVKSLKDIKPLEDVKSIEDINVEYKPVYSLLLPEDTLVLPRTPTTPISKTPTPISKTPTPMLEVPTPMSPISFNVLSNSLINHKEDLENITHELYDVKDNMAVLQNKLSISYSLIGLAGILGFAAGFILNKK